MGSRMMRSGLLTISTMALLGIQSGCHNDWQQEMAVGRGSSQSIPQFGETVRATNPPPPISGGTLVVGRDGVTAVAADPDRDRIYIVDLSTKHLVADLALQAGDEPGRITEGASQQ